MSLNLRHFNFRGLFHYRPYHRREILVDGVSPTQFDRRKQSMADDGKT